MKTSISCLREFEKLPEAEQPGYLITHGDALTVNSGVFPDIPHDGTSITTKGGELLTTWGLRKKSVLAMKNYTDKLIVCKAWMEANYDDVDLVAQGDGDIVAKAGVNGTSTNTARIGIPSLPADVKYAFADLAGEILLMRAVDKLAMGGVTVTSAAAGLTVVRSSDTQLKITTADGTVVFVDVETTVKTTVKNQIAGSKINSWIANFNTNGITDVASPAPVIVPR